MLFRTQYDHIEIETPAGSPEVITYSSYYDKNGDIKLKVSGKKNLYEYIQSFKDSVDINLLIKRFVAGDVNALNNKEAMFMDLTELPRDKFDAINQYNDAKELFKQLPQDIRDKFSNNPDEFYGKTGTGEWYDKLGLTKTVIVKDVKPLEVNVPEVKEENVNE